MVHHSIRFIRSVYFFFFGAFPMPDNPTDCGEPVALSTILRLPVSPLYWSMAWTTGDLAFLAGCQRLVALRFYSEDRWRRGLHLDAHWERRLSCRYS